MSFIHRKGMLRDKYVCIYAKGCTGIKWVEGGLLVVIYWDEDEGLERKERALLD